MGVCLHGYLYTAYFNINIRHCQSDCTIRCMYDNLTELSNDTLLNIWTAVRDDALPLPSSLLPFSLSHELYLNYFIFQTMWPKGPVNYNDNIRLEIKHIKRKNTNASRIRTLYFIIAKTYQKGKAKKFKIVRFSSRVASVFACEIQENDVTTTFWSQKGGKRLHLCRHWGEFRACSCAVVSCALAFAMACFSLNYRSIYGFFSDNFLIMYFLLVSYFLSASFGISIIVIDPNFSLIIGDFTSEWSRAHLNTSRQLSFRNLQMFTIFIM